MARRLGFLAVWLVLYVASSAAVPCVKTGAEPPSVRTLIASKDHSDTEAWVVAPDCTVTVIPVNKTTLLGETYINLDLDDATLAIQRIESIPTTTTVFHLVGSNVSLGGNFTGPPKLQTMYERSLNFMIDTAFENLENFAFPNTLTNLSDLIIRHGDDSLRATSKIIRGRLRTMKGTRLPAALDYLDLRANALRELDFALPTKLTTLLMTSNLLTSLPPVTFPSSMKSIMFDRNGITNVRGCRWPNTIRDISLPPKTSLEVRESDFAVLSTSQLTGADQQTACADSSARLAYIGSNQLCVISDSRFEQLYGASNAQSSGSEGDGVGVKPPTTDTTKEPTGATFSATAISGIVVGVAVVLVVTVLGCRRWKKRRSSDGYVKTTENSQKASQEFQAVQSPSSSGLTGNSDGSQESLQNDIRNNATINQFRLNEREVELTKLVARGGFGIIHQAVYRGQDVAVKQMLPGTWRDSTALGKFMDEIRLCATLKHPKIVQFVGITWTSLVDLAVVTEFMGGGDLHDLLYKNAASEPVTWYESWTSTHGQQIKAKTQIAQDIVQGISYLHAFPTPVLHRDLKARNVLLDTQGDAKLSDFGISRELVLDKTMTREVGTSAWIAPEVLRGERYSEKADIYSLGVLLVEMDRCGHPFGSQSMKSYQVAVLVSTGSLRPETTSECPAGIRSLVERCVSFDPASRPTVMEVHDALRAEM